jgi:hypothetical protein
MRVNPYRGEFLPRVIDGFFHAAFIERFLP